ncbi:MAG TPA: ABC transporter [Lachnospiraceae bacterium]|nr:ABC transporter [Lachnospiraceae bacterium]
MLIWENIKIACKALFSNKLRALLTMLGIIIGIGSVIAIMTVSESLTTSISKSFQEMGANNVTVGLSAKSDEEEVRADGMRFGASGRNVSVTEEDRITDRMISKLKKTFKNQIAAVAVSESAGTASVSRDGDSVNINVSGVNQDYFESDQVTLLAGRLIKKADLSGKKHVIVVSDQLVESMFDGDNDAALWQKINVNINGNYQDFYIVGVYEYESAGTVSDSDDVTTNAYIPLATEKEIMRSDDGYTQFTIVTDTSVSSVSAFADQVEAFFTPYYASNDNYEIATSTMESMTESMSEMVHTVSLAISLIAGISLLVGGIGVMNIMLVSITERTREIGTRKALGATNGSIRLQFIIESMVLCLVGGCLGIVLGLILGSVAASVLGYSATAPVAAIFVAVLFSMVVGVFFGYYPANKAARMDPIEALRYE